MITITQFVYSDSEKITYDEFLEIVEDDKSFSNVMDYAQSLGYGSTNLSDNKAVGIMEIKQATKMEFKDGDLIYTTISHNTVDNNTADNNTADTFISWYELKDTPAKDTASTEDITSAFLSEFEIKDDNLQITLFNEKGGMSIDLIQNEIIEVWGDTIEECNPWICAGNAMDDILKKWDFWTDCGYFCKECGLYQGSEPICCGSCFECLLDKGWLGISQCTEDFCFWYPCQKICSNQDYYSDFSSYCDGNDIRTRQFSHEFTCSSEIPKEGICMLDLDSSDWINDTVLENCDIGCIDGACQTSTDIEQRLSDLELRHNDLQKEVKNINMLIENIKINLDRFLLFFDSVIEYMGLIEKHVNYNTPVICSSDDDCIEDSYIGEAYCSSDNVYQTLRSYECIRPGTDFSFCHRRDKGELIMQCSNGCDKGECLRLPSDHKVIFRTNVDNYSYYDCGTRSNCWIAFDFDNDSQLDAMGYDGKSTRCHAGDILLNITNGFVLIDYGNSRRLAICTDEGKEIRFSTSRDADDAELSSEPTEPFASNNQEVYLEENDLPTRCSSDQDCGEPTLIGEPYCLEDELYQQLNTFECIRPDTNASLCNATITEEMIEFCENGCDQAKCIRNDSGFGVVFRTNVPANNYYDCGFMSNCWIAIDFDGDGLLDAMGYDGKSNTCSDGSTLLNTPEGFNLVDYGHSTRLVICTSEDKEVRFSIVRQATDVELSQEPTEPYASSNQETYME